MVYQAIKRDNIACTTAMAVITGGLFFTMMTASPMYQITTTVLFSWWVFAVVAFYAARKWPQILWGIVPLAFALLGSMFIEFASDPIRLKGFMANDNHAAGLLTLGIAFLLTRKPTQDQWPFDWYALAALPLAFGVMMTGSRLALIVVAFSFFVYAFQRNNLKLAVMLVTVLAIGLLNSDIAAGLRMQSDHVADIGGRLNAGMVPNGLLGQESGWLFFHNAPVQIAYNAGWPAAIAWLGLAGGSVLYAIRKHNGLMLVLPALMLCTLDHYFWWPGTLAPLFWAVMGATHARA
jgi:hypothetical protein